MPARFPVLVDFEVNGRTIKAILWANRNGFFYVLDRETGRFLLGKEFATQTWAQGLDDSGHPIRVPGHGAVTRGTVGLSRRHRRLELVVAVV